MSVIFINYSALRARLASITPKAKVQFTPDPFPEHSWRRRPVTTAFIFLSHLRYSGPNGCRSADRLEDLSYTPESSLPQGSRRLDLLPPLPDPTLLYPTHCWRGGGSLRSRTAFTWLCACLHAQLVRGRSWPIPSIRVLYSLLQLPVVPQLLLCGKQTNKN